MIINVKLVGLFQTDRFKQQDREYPNGIKVQHIINDLQLPQQHCGIVLINGVHAGINSLVTEGDQVVIMPVVDGG